VAHQRKLIRQAIVARLLAANTAAGDRVTSTRIDPHKKTRLPAISVYCLREPVVDPGMDSSIRELTRDAKFEIVAWVRHSDSLPAADAIDDIAEQIENAMSSDETMGGAASDSSLESTEIEIADEGGPDPLVGIVALTYSVIYRTSPVDGTADTFVTAGERFRPPEMTVDNDMQDLFNVQEPT
jgi:hypothetical protein